VASTVVSSITGVERQARLVSKGAVERQKETCRRYGASYFESPSGSKVGIARNVRDGVMPLNGLRHPPQGDATGWYIWAGETLSSDPDFFVPLHVEHVAEWCPEALTFLGLPPGWRFLVAAGHEDAWKDENLLELSES
jgi:hypothetical protein